MRSEYNRKRVAQYVANLSPEEQASTNFQIYPDQMGENELEDAFEGEEMIQPQDLLRNPGLSPTLF